MKTIDPTNDESIDNDDILNDGSGDTIDNEELTFNTEANSFELDVKSDDPDYDHPDPYNTAPIVGDDFDSSYDEANPTAVDEYIGNESLETDVSQLGMHIDNGQILSVNAVDESLAHTPEDDRDDLDEEGYPKNDTPDNIKL
ncbi:hypothetical protein [Mucilaginibacter antarcticus]|uniref:Uncharacterized protein n=1 Tax=Mucilaginibacter antarcticus TaxID=1855725 RepID=A0ABW5XS73_9SPHI